MPTDVMSLESIMSEPTTCDDVVEEVWLVEPASTEVVALNGEKIENVSSWAEEARAVGKSSSMEINESASCTQNVDESGEI